MSTLHNRKCRLLVVSLINRQLLYSTSHGRSSDVDETGTRMLFGLMAHVVVNDAEMLRLLMLRLRQLQAPRTLITHVTVYRQLYCLN